MGASGLGALLVKEGFLTEQDRVTITKTCGQSSWAFAKSILAAGLLDEDELAAFFAERTKYVVAPKNLLEQLDVSIIEHVDRRMIARLEVLPLEIDHQKITVAVADPLDKSTLKQLEFFTGLEVVPVIAPLSQIYEGLNQLSPDFKPRPTALSNFLRNHAGTAWIKQKIVEGADTHTPALQQRKLQDEDYVFDDEQVEEVTVEDDAEAPEGPDEDFPQHLSPSTQARDDSSFEDSSDVDAELDLAQSELADAAAPSDTDDAHELDLDAPFDTDSNASQPMQDLASFDDDTMGQIDESQDADEMLSEPPPDGPILAAESGKLPSAVADDDLLGDLPDLGFDTSSAGRSGSASSAMSSTGGQKTAKKRKKEGIDDFATFEFDQDEDTSAALRKAVQQKDSRNAASQAGFSDLDEDTSIDLHGLDDDEPVSADTVTADETLDAVSPAPSERRKVDIATFEAEEAGGLEELSMGFEEGESIDEPISKPTQEATIPSRINNSEPAQELFDGPGIENLPPDAATDLVDIPIYASSAPTRAGGRAIASPDNGSAASLTSTAKANEALLRMSLCTDRAAAVEVAKEYLPQISSTGCLVHIGKSTEALATWRRGAQSASDSKAAATFQRLAKQAKAGQWAKVKLSGHDDLFGPLKSMSVYKIQKKDGRILILAGDYPIDDDSLREVLTSFAEQLGAKQDRVG